MSKTIDEVFSYIKPINLGRRFIFQEYCKSLGGTCSEAIGIEIDKYTSDEFLYGGYKNLHKREKDFYKEYCEFNCKGWINLWFNKPKVKDVFEKLEKIRVNGEEDLKADNIIEEINEIINNHLNFGAVCINKVTNKFMFK